MRYQTIFFFFSHSERMTHGSEQGVSALFGEGVGTPLVGVLTTICADSPF